MKIIFYAVTLIVFSSGILASQISDAEKEFILLTRQEEKLARDFYDSMNRRYGLRLFENISAAESRHMEYAAYLLVKFNIEDPVSGEFVSPGVFRNKELSSLFAEMNEKGTSS